MQVADLPDSPHVVPSPYLCDEDSVLVWYYSGSWTWTEVRLPDGSTRTGVYDPAIHDRRLSTPYLAGRYCQLYRELGSHSLAINKVIEELRERNGGEEGG